MKVYTVGGILSVAAILAAVFSLIYNSVGLSNDVSNTISDFRENTRTKIAGQQNQIDALEKQIGALRNQLNRYRALQTRPPPPPQNP